MAPTTNLDDIIRKVQGLLAQADHANTGPAEAEAFRTKAEAMMFKYRIEEMQLTKDEKQSMARNIVWRTFRLGDAYSEFRSQYGAFAYQVIAHMDIRGVTRTTTIDSDYAMVVEMVGYESDLRFAELILTAAVLEFGSKLEPKMDANTSDQINAYRMRSAGMEGRRIAMAIYGRDDKALRPKVRKMFADEAIARGEDPTPLLGRGSNMKLFRESYAAGFVQTFGGRLYNMRYSRGVTSHEIALVGRKAEIDEAFYAKFPQYRPLPAVEGAVSHTCTKCENAKSGYCRDHAFLRPRKGAVRYANTTAYARGADAARSVNLGITGREVS